MKKKSTKQLGQIASLSVQLEATRRNYIVSIPNTEERYDFIIDDGKKISRVQVKSLEKLHSDVKHHKSLAFDLKIYRYHRNRRTQKVYSSKEIDLLLVYMPTLNVILAFGPKTFHKKKSIYITVSNPKSKWYYKNFLW